jgi:hypothetical protein
MVVASCEQVNEFLTGSFLICHFQSGVCYTPLCWYIEEEFIIRNISENKQRRNFVRQLPWAQMTSSRAQQGKREGELPYRRLFMQFILTIGT